MGARWRRYSWRDDARGEGAGRTPLVRHEVPPNDIAGTLGSGQHQRRALRSNLREIGSDIKKRSAMLGGYALRSVV